MTNCEKDYMTISDALSVLAEFGVSVLREKINLSAMYEPIVELSFKDLFGDAYGPAKVNQPLVFIMFRSEFRSHNGCGAVHADEAQQWHVEASVYNRPITGDCVFIRQCILGKRKTPFGSQGYVDMKPGSFLILSTREFRKNLAELKCIVKLRNDLIAHCATSKSCQQYRENIERIKKMKAENDALFKAFVRQYDRKGQLVYESAENEQSHI